MRRPSTTSSDLLAFLLMLIVVCLINVFIEVGQYWVTHRQQDAVDNLGMVDILQGLILQREMERELQHFPVIGTGCCRPSFHTSSISFLTAQVLFGFPCGYRGFFPVFKLYDLITLSYIKLNLSIYLLALLTKDVLAHLPSRR